MKENFNWYEEPKQKQEKETFYGSWEDFEKATGMTKEQYFDRERKNNFGYCSQNSGDCKNCSLANYGYDCHNNKF